jgi:hypothetical protein
MSKLRVEKSFGQIAGGLEAPIESIDRIRIKYCTRVRGAIILIFEDGCYPESSYVF